MRHHLPEIPPTGAAMNRRGITGYIAFVIAGFFLVAGSENGVADSQERDPWRDAPPFTKPLDQAVKYGDPIDPLNPPPLSVWELFGNSKELTAMADYINLGPKKVRLHGRMIKDRTGGARRFYPYARLEVFNETSGDWELIGRSPSGKAGIPSTALMVPVKLGVANPQAKANEPCLIDMDPFRKYVRKFRYCRIVLDDGATSQTLGLNDLLPPEDSFRIGKNETSSRDQVTSEKVPTAGQHPDWLHGIADDAKSSNPSSAKTREDTLPAAFRTPPPP